jgi:glutathione S-transferase
MRRAVLNYKRIPYKTEWVPYPDIAPTLQRLGGSPTDTVPDGNPYYTLPAIIDSSGDTPVIVTDSLSIAEYLDAKYPERPVLPERGKALQYVFEDTFRRTVGQHLPKILVPLIWHILDERSQVYYRKTRERWYRTPGYGKLEDWSPEGPVREGHWALLKTGFDTLAMILDKNGPGVMYVAGGTEPTRADMIIVGYLAWLIAATPEDWENRVRHWNDGRWDRLWKISEPWRVVC